MDELYSWYVEHAYPSIKDFIVPLLPWISLSVIATILDMKLTYELYRIDKDKNPKPQWSRFVNKLVNCILLVLLGGCCKLTLGMELGVTIVSTVLFIAFACLEVTKCLNKFMQIENVGIKINLLNLFKATKIRDVIEKNDNDKEND